MFENIVETGARARGTRRGQPLLINEILTRLLRKIYFMVKKFSWDTVLLKHKFKHNYCFVFQNLISKTLKMWIWRNFDGNLGFIKASVALNFLEHTEILWRDGSGVKIFYLFGQSVARCDQDKPLSLWVDTRSTHVFSICECLKNFVCCGNFLDTQNINILLLKLRCCMS